MNKEQKEKAKEILTFLESKMLVSTENGKYKIIDEEWIDENLFSVMYTLDGIVNGMYDNKDRERVTKVE